MGLGVGERQRLGALGDEAHKALARAHGRQMHRLAVEALGGEEFEPTVRAQHIDRADLGHHVGGDVHDDLVQTRLWADRLRHDFAEPAQQQPWSGMCATQWHRSLSAPPVPGLAAAASSGLTAR